MMRIQTGKLKTQQPRKWVVLKTSGWAAHRVTHPDTKNHYLLGITRK